MLRFLLGAILLVLCAPILLVIAAVGLPLLIVAGVLVGVGATVALALLSVPLIVVAALGSAALAVPIALAGAALGAVGSVGFGLLKLAFLFGATILLGYAVIRFLGARREREY
jgi:hypothetical protein